MVAVEDQIFYTSLYTFVGSFILGILAIMYKSKCDSMNLCWGFIQIHRNVEVELAGDLRQLEAPREVPQPVD